MVDFILSALFGGVTGLAGSLLSGVMSLANEWMRGKNDQRLFDHEFRLQQLNIEARGKELESELAIADTYAAATIREASYEHDTGYGPTYKWVASALRMVRPVVTILLCVLTYMIWQQSQDPALRYDIGVQVVYLTGMAIAWWFGDRRQGTTKSNG